MKKSVVAVIVVMLTLSSCSIYTCPTYAKKASELPAKKARI